MPDPDLTIAPARGTRISPRVNMCSMGELLLIRHGETAWSRTGQYAGRTDLPLTDAGVAAARALGPVLARRPLAAAFSSPLSRAVRTAELAGLADVKPDPDLLEWDYGDYEGSTEEQIRAARPEWDLWRDGVSAGETLTQVAARTDAVLDRVRPLLRDGDVAIFGHGHLQRVLAARWLGLDPAAGRMLSHPRTGTLSSLAYEHEQPVISAWNVLP
jgi:broad specificity phosphatase PhoE